jgi:hypothetical protein
VPLGRRRPATRGRQPAGRFPATLTIVTTRTRISALAALGSVLLVGLVLLPSSPFTAPAPSWKPAGPTAKGVFHVHTRRSDGTGTIDDVAAAAAHDGLQFVIITDHGDGTRAPVPPAYRSGVLCIDAVEISTTGGHYAALGIGQTPYPLGGEPRDVIEDVRRLGGFGVVTHPLSAKSDLAWRDWDSRMDAVEWLNGDSLWREVPRGRLAASAFTYLVRPVASIAHLYQRRPAMLSRWDGIDRAWRVIALTGTDAHARIGLADGPEPYENSVYLRAPSYEVAFGLASLRVGLAGPLSGQPAADAAAIIDAIRAGRVHTVVDGVGRGGVFEFSATSGAAHAQEGGQIPMTDPAVIRVRSNPPADGWLVLYRNGTQVHRVRGQELTYASDLEGSYRAEVWAPSPGGSGFVPWIVGNPIMVGEPGRLPEPEPVDAGGTPWWLQPDSNAWSVEQGAGSKGTIQQDGETSFAYQLGGSDRSSSPYAALVARTPIPRGAAGIAFVARADRPMRVSVQLRMPTAGEGLRWRRSVYLEPTPREVFIPFADMRPVGPVPHGPPTISAVRALLFVVDLVNSAPTSAGRFVVKDVRFYAPTVAGKPL